MSETTTPTPSSQERLSLEEEVRDLTLGRTGSCKTCLFISELPDADAYTGHYHTHNEHAMGDGQGAWYQTGSTESDNRYARNAMGKQAQPSQRLHFVDPVRGRVTGQYKVWVG